MMFTWEWNPSFGAEKKPQQFEQAGSTWTYARGARFDFFFLPVFLLLWAAITCLSKEPLPSKLVALSIAVSSGIGWYVSRRVHEHGWRLDENQHLVVLMRNGVARDLGKVIAIKPVAESDFERFNSRGFNSLRFPMLQFKGAGKSAGVLGTQPSSSSQGFQIPFTLGFFYSSITWGSFQVAKGTDQMAWVETDGDNQWLVIAYTPEAISQGLAPSSSNLAPQAP